MRLVSNFNEGWNFVEGFSPTYATAFMPGQAVSLPHNAVELPFSYFDETSYQREFSYQKMIRWEDRFSGKEVVLRFDAAMANSVVYLNGEELAAHKDGYTPFEVRLTERLNSGENLLTVKIDGSENPAIPPFGNRIDYLTYAGIYRDAWLKVLPPVFIANVKVETRQVLEPLKGVSVRVDLMSPGVAAIAGLVTATLREAGGRVIASATAAAAEQTVLDFAGLAGIRLWDLDTPVLYTMDVALVSPAGDDAVSTAFGFRTAEFTVDGFFLNGRLLKLRGLNRHQAYPYVGYAMGKRAQELDARLLKHELKVNLARTSHYPQSPYFLDECDRIGLLVLEEIPGWQHIGDEAWQAESVNNVRSMIERDWNHPSIILWGVRINESRDNHDFYVRTNAMARALDTTRQTGGIRCIPDSELLEDVYTMNDFVLGEEELPQVNRPRTELRDQREVTGLTHDVPYLVTEYNGHMYPTRNYDQEQRQAEHVRRHLAVLNAVHGRKNISGAIGWCMFDYNTHKDFGSGDRICYHGVTDMFRTPKFAAYAYASQCEPEEEVILQPVTFWARGERNIGGVLPLIILTNCDEVELHYQNGVRKRVGPDVENYPHLPHPPVVIDHRHFSREELGMWGMEWKHGELTGFIGGKAVKTLHLMADPLPTTLSVVADDTRLSAVPRDAVRVIVKGLDQAGNILPFVDDIISIAVSGPARVIGPTRFTLKGGTFGFWLETTGGHGEISVTASSGRFPRAQITLVAE